MHHRDSAEYMFTAHISNILNTHQNNVKFLMCKIKSFDKNQLESYSQQYHPISMAEGQLPDRILELAG